MEVQSGHDDKDSASSGDIGRDELAIEKPQDREKHASVSSKRDQITLAQAATQEPQHPPPVPRPATDWESPDDPDNPHNWNASKKLYHIIIPGLFGFAITFGTSAYTPAVPGISSYFNVSRTAAIVGLTLYTLGLGLGPVMTAPLSERYGRKIVYLVTGPMSMLFTLGAGFSQTLASLMVCRWFAGLCGSAALAVGAGTASDLYEPMHRAKVMAIFLIAPFAGPSLGPIAGGFAAQYKGWRWTQWCILFVNLSVYLCALPMKETYKPIIIKKRAKRRGIELPKSAQSLTVKRSVMMLFVRPLHMLVTEPVVFFLSLYTAFAFAILFLCFAAIPFVFQRPPYSFSVSQTGLIFLSIGLGVLLAGATGFVIDTKLYQVKHREAVAAGQAHAQPEHRLYNAMIGSLGIPVGLFWFGWTANGGVHWAVPTVGLIPFAWGNLCLFISAALYIADVYGALNGASAMAANGIFRYTLGAVFPLFTVQMYETLGIGWATSLLGFLSILMLPIPWVLFKYGPTIRKRSRYPVMM